MQHCPSWTTSVCWPLGNTSQGLDLSDAGSLITAGFSAWANQHHLSQYRPNISLSGTGPVLITAHFPTLADQNTNTVFQMSHKQQQSLRDSQTSQVRTPTLHFSQYYQVTTTAHEAKHLTVFADWVPHSHICHSNAPLQDQLPSWFDVINTGTKSNLGRQGFVSYDRS